MVYLGSWCSHLPFGFVIPLSQNNIFSYSMHFSWVFFINYIFKLSQIYLPQWALLPRPPPNHVNCPIARPWCNIVHKSFISSTAALCQSYGLVFHEITKGTLYLKECGLLSMYVLLPWIPFFSAYHPQQITHIYCKVVFDYFNPLLLDKYLLSFYTFSFAIIQASYYGTTPE